PGNFRVENCRVFARVCVHIVEVSEVFRFTSRRNGTVVLASLPRSFSAPQIFRILGAKSSSPAWPTVPFGFFASILVHRANRFVPRKRQPIWQLLTSRAEPHISRMKR